MRTQLITLSVAFLLLYSSYGLAEGGMGHEGHAGAMMVNPTEATATSTEVIEVGNTICPVSGEKIGQMGKVETYEYNGKLYNLCCPMCKKDFKKDPEKYSKIAEEQAAKAKSGE